MSLCRNWPFVRSAEARHCLFYPCSGIQVGMLGAKFKRLSEMNRNPSSRAEGHVPGTATLLYHVPNGDDFCLRLYCEHSDAGFERLHGPAERELAFGINEHVPALIEDFNEVL